MYRRANHQARQRPFMAQHSTQSLSPSDWLILQRNAL